MTQNNTKKNNAQKKPASKANANPKTLAPKKPTVADIAKAQQTLIERNEAQYQSLVENDDRILDAIIATSNANRSGFAQLGENQGTIARSLENHEAGEVERFNKLKKLIESISGFGLSGIWMGVTFVLMILAVVIVTIVMGLSGATALEIIFAGVGMACAVMAFSLFAAMAKGR